MIVLSTKPFNKKMGLVWPERSARPQPLKQLPISSGSVD